ncbi:MAG: sensor domain-containing protein [Propionibacteriaceae bacterium]|nr:sensor domain-containing protein [Propionibacteriaceae bacterium]
MTTTAHPTPSPVRRFLRDTGYLLLSFPFRTLVFILSAISFALSFGTVLIWVGVLGLALSLRLSRGFAEAERRFIGWLGDHRPASACYLPPDPKLPRWRRMLWPVFDRQCWLDAAWAVSGFFISAITWSLTILWLVGTAVIVLGPVSRMIPGSGSVGFATQFGWPSPAVLDPAIDALLGIGFGLSAPFVIGWLAEAQRYLSRALLCLPAEMHRLRAAQTAARRAESDARQRLERDIHDGPQQRLIRISMDLGRARRRVLDDPSSAAEILDGLVVQTQATLAELRQLSRGIAPPILTDRGLGAALREAASLSAVPVTVEADLPRLNPLVEQSAYFVASEALANINKHARAASAQIRARLGHGVLVLSVTDDGIGGADPAKGHGLTGLEHRLAGIGATLSVVSPDGGPTRIEAVIPCE